MFSLCVCLLFDFTPLFSFYFIDMWCLILFSLLCYVVEERREIYLSNRWYAIFCNSLLYLVLALAIVYFFFSCINFLFHIFFIFFLSYLIAFVSLLLFLLLSYSSLLWSPLFFSDVFLFSYYRFYFCTIFISFTSLLISFLWFFFLLSYSFISHFFFFITILLSPRFFFTVR